MHNLLQEHVNLKETYTVDGYRDITVYHLNSLPWVLTGELHLKSCLLYMSNYNIL